MPSAKGNIHARLRQKLDGDADSVRHGRVEDHIRARKRGPLVPVSQKLIERFSACAHAMQMTTAVVGDLDAVVSEVGYYLQSNNLRGSGCIWPELLHLNWRSAGIFLEARVANNVDQIGVTTAFAGIAETGTLMMLSGRKSPSSVSLLPETHIAVLDCNRIVPHMEDAWNLARKNGDFPSRAVTFISGPSCTGDIEQTIVVGAHGPLRVHVILLNAGGQ